jgi:hypothetical protein
MAEWKTVDKEIWLKTFETEEGAAGALDAAQKLLICKKKQPTNFPCIELVAYLEQIPPNFPCIELVAYLGQIPLNLNLKNLGNDAMFKDVTLFIKLKAKEYAVKFFPLCNNHRSSKDFYANGNSLSFHHSKANQPLALTRSFVSVLKGRINSSPFFFLPTIKTINNIYFSVVHIIDMRL